MQYLDAVDGLDIADALLVGRLVPKVKLRNTLVYGDSADALYVRLAEVLERSSDWLRLTADVRSLCPNELVQPWLTVFRYANGPNSNNFRKMAEAVAAEDPAAGIVMRLSRIVLVGRHRQIFARLLRDLAADNPFLVERNEVIADLVEYPGPMRAIARRGRGRPMAAKVA